MLQLRDVFLPVKSVVIPTFIPGFGSTRTDEQEILQIMHIIAVHAVSHPLHDAVGDCHHLHRHC